MHPLFLLKTLTIVYRHDPKDFDEIINNYMDAGTVEQLVSHISRLTKKSLEQKVILSQQEKIDHLTQMVEYLHTQSHNVMLHWRGIDPQSQTVCTSCDGTGSHVEMRGGSEDLSEKEFKPIPCRECGGSGDTANPWHRIIESSNDSIVD